MVMIVFALVGQGYQNEQNPQETSLVAPMASVPWFSAAQDSNGKSIASIIFPEIQKDSSCSFHLTEYEETSICALSP